MGPVSAGEWLEEVRAEVDYVYQHGSSSSKIVLMAGPRQFLYPTCEEWRSGLDYTWRSTMRAQLEQAER